MAIPLSVVLLSFFNLCLNLIVVTIFTLAAGVHPMLTWLEVPLIVALMVVLGQLRDVVVLAVVVVGDMSNLENVRQILFYVSPVIIPVTTVQEKVDPTVLHIYMLRARWRWPSSSSATRS